MPVNPIARSVVATVLVTKEAAYGTPLAPTKDIGLVTGGGVNPDSPIKESHGQGQANAVYVNPSIVDPKGSFEIELQHGRPIEYAIFGGTTTHVETTGDFTHTFVWSNSLPSLTAECSWELGTTDICQKMTSLIFKSATISASVDAPLKMRTDWIAKDIDNSATTATAAVVNTSAPMHGFKCGLSLGGSTVEYVKSWEITVNRNSSNFHGQGARSPGYGASHLANVDFKATIGLSTTTEINRLLGSASSITAAAPTSFAGIFSYDNGVTLGSGKRAVTLTLSGCQLASYNNPLTLGDFVVYDISGKGLISAGTCVDQITSATW